MSASVNPNMQFLTISVDTCGESTGRGHGDWYGEIVRDMGMEQEHVIREWGISMHGASRQGHGTRIWDKGTRNDHV